MLTSIKLPLRFDPARLKADLDSVLKEEYFPHFNKGYYQGDWSVVPLRSIGGAVNQFYPATPDKWDQFADTPLLARCPYIQQVLSAFDCPFQAVRFLRLGPGSVIKEHRDFQLGFEDGEVRLHIPVLTNPGVLFILAGNRIIMREGECWYSDFNEPHSVRNDGDTPRVHLVLDCVLSDWLKNLLLDAAKDDSGWAEQVIPVAVAAKKLKV